MPYTLPDEQKLDIELSALLSEWKKIVCTEKTSSELFVEDGFYPFYTQQPVKILFIGREALGMAGLNYVKTLFEAYKANSVGEKSLDKYKFHHLMFYIAYGIIQREPDWKKIPYASKLAENFGTQNGISFAFMNLSKFSNESGSWEADNLLIDSFLEKSQKAKENLFNKEIELLSPDLIFTMNLEGRINFLGEITERQNGKDVDFMKLKTGSRQIPLLNTWHFASPNKSEYQNFFKPIVKTLQKHGLFEFSKNENSTL